jgi:hypothetical protein
VISRQPGVLKVAVAERMNGLTRLLVHAAASRPSATSLAGVLEQADIAAEEIYLRRPTLDDVFREITTATEH